MATTTSITLPVSADDSEDVRFEVIRQSDDIGGCSGYSHANTTNVTGASDSYDITRLEEDSCYKITVIKFRFDKRFNNTVSSQVSMFAVTPEAGERESLSVVMSL